jgi:hypothetical protein
MADLKPIGSEKLQGQDKLRRIMEIARFNEVIPNRINETAKSEYSRSLADGNNYEIIKERQGYIIKRTISESETDYIEPMKNRKYYSSYSQALKRLNLVAGELNRINENEEGTSMFGEQKKFTLKTPKPKMDLPEPPAAPSAPPAVPSPELPPSPMGDMGMDDMGMDDMGMDDMGMEDDMEIDTDIEVDGEPADSNEQVTFKTIQKLTGKLTQKIRTLDNEEGMTSEDIKYVVNMVLSSVNLNELSEEDREDILSKFEDETEDLGGDDMGGEDLTDDSEVEDIQADMDIPMEGDMEEGYEYDDVDEINPDDLFNDQESYKFSKFKKRHNKSKSDELDEFFYYDDESEESDDKTPIKPLARKTSKGNKFGSFDDENWYDNEDVSYGGDFDFDYDDEEFHDYPSFKEKHGDTRWFGNVPGDSPQRFFDKHKELSGGKPFKVRTKRSNLGNGAIFDSIFGESKVDKVLSKYFEVTKKEIVENKQKTEEKKTRTITEVRKQMKSVVKLTETIEQELASQKFLEENVGAKIVGKTNKNNLVFQNKGKEIKITPEGLLV